MVINVNVTIVPPNSSSSFEEGETRPLAITATLSSASAQPNDMRISASALKKIIFGALAAAAVQAQDTMAPPDSTIQGEDIHSSQGTTPIVLALEAVLSSEEEHVAGPVASTVTPLVHSAAIRTSIQALERDLDYWAIECRGMFIIQDHELLDLRVDQPTHDVRLVPLHTIPPPPFVVVSHGTRCEIALFVQCRRMDNIFKHVA